MDPAFISLLSFLTIAILISFICSILEAVLLSTTPSFIATQRGHSGKRLAKLKQDIDQPLAAILTLNTFAHTIGAAGVGAMAQSIWGEASLTVVSTVVTILILIVSEIIPKTLGAIYWKRLARPASLICQWLTWLLYPIVIFCLLITRALRKDAKSNLLTRTDVSEVVSFGFRDGFIRKHEKEIIENLMDKEHLSTREIMTPKDRVVSLNEAAPTSMINPNSNAWHVSRIPIYAQTVDSVTGYVLKDEILAAQLSGEKENQLTDYKRSILEVDPKTDLKDLYNMLISEDEHIAVVKDDNKLLGVVTMEDVIEEILGQEIVDESDLARGIVD